MAAIGTTDPGSGAAAGALARAAGVLVLGLDGGDGDAGALLWTKAVAAAAGSRVVAVHALPTLEGMVHDVPPFGATAWRVRLRAEVERRWCAPLREAGVPFEVRLLEGGVAAALLNTAAAVGADLLVVGSRARRGLGGSLATHLVHRASCPVLVVPPG